MKTLPILAIPLLAGSLLLGGCASTNSDSSSQTTTETQPLVTTETTANTDPRDGWVELEPAPMPYGPVYISIKCQGTALLYVSQYAALTGAIVVTENASECVG